jgi:hypothetical protein
MILDPVEDGLGEGLVERLEDERLEQAAVPVDHLRVALLGRG